MLSAIFSFTIGVVPDQQLIDFPHHRLFDTLMRLVRRIIIVVTAALCSIIDLPLPQSTGPYE